MGEPFIGEIRIFPYGYSPKGWASCNGDRIYISQAPALYSVISTIYGGDGYSYFFLPNLNGRTPIHKDNYLLSIGNKGGSNSAALSANQIPNHTHRLVATSNKADKELVENNHMLAQTKLGYGEEIKSYAAVSDNPTKLKMNIHSMTAETGENRPHENRQPSMIFNFCIALSGIYPPRP